MESHLRSSSQDAPVGSSSPTGASPSRNQRFPLEAAERERLTKACWLAGSAAIAMLLAIDRRTLDSAMTGFPVNLPTRRAVRAAIEKGLL